MTTTAPDREKVLARVRNLLAKAERTDNPHEAEAFSAKATELIDRHRIDVAALRAAEDRGPEFGRHGFHLATYRYLRASRTLLTIVAEHFGVIVLVAATGNSKRVTLVGDREDVEDVTMFFRSLALQRDRACVATPVPPGTHTTRFRNSFAYGYAFRIRTRLRDLRAGQERAARDEGNTAALVVYARADQVVRWLGRQMGEPVRNAPKLNGITVDGYGAHEGDRAARRADLGQGHVGRGTRPALNA